MGRGLSDQQRRILAAAVAVNAHRNGGTPRAAELVIDRPKTERSCRVALSVDCVDVFDEFVYVAIGGFRAGGRELVVCRSRTLDESGRPLREDTVRRVDRKFDRDTASQARRVSLYRAVGTLVRRGLLVIAPGARHFDRRPWDTGLVTRDHVVAADVATRFGLPQFPPRADDTRGYYLTAAGIEATGDRWHELNVDELLEHWETARRIR